MVVSVGLLLFLVIVGMVLVAGVLLWKSKGLAAVLVVAGFLFILGLGLVSLLSVQMEESRPVTMSAQLPNAQGFVGPDFDAPEFIEPDSVGSEFNGPFSNGQGAVVVQSSPGTLVPEIAPPNAPITPQPAGIQAPNAMVSTSVGNPSWMDADEDVFAIDHFPSVASAIGPLVRETMAKLEESEGSSTDAASDNSEAKRIYVWVKGSRLEGIRKRGPRTCPN